MAAKKKQKVTGLRLTEEARRVLYEISDEGLMGQSEFVSALLELSGEDMNKTRDHVTAIRRRQARLHSARAGVAMGARREAWTHYLETWPKRLDGTENIELGWTRGEIEQIADRFATRDYWSDKFHHFIKCEEVDRKKLRRSWCTVLCALPLPIRYRCFETMCVIIHDEFNYPVDEPDETLESVMDENIEGLVTDLFDRLPFPVSNQWRGVSLGVQDRISGDTNTSMIGVVNDVFSTDDWEVLMEALDSAFTDAGDLQTRELVNKTIQRLNPWTEGDKHWRNVHGEDREVKCREEISRFCNVLDVSLHDILPKTHVELWGDMQGVSTGRGKKFDINKGPFPRSPYLVQIAASLLIARQLEVTLTVKDFYRVVDCAKSQVSQLLKEWSVFFERERTEKGTLKRNGSIHLSNIGHEYFTAARCVKEGGLPAGWKGDIKIAGPKGKRLVLWPDQGSRWKAVCRQFFHGESP